VIILGFNSEGKDASVDSVTHPLAEYTPEEIEIFGVCLGALRSAVRTQDPRLLGRVATASARISQRYLPKAKFDRVLRLAEEVGALGVQVAHSGTVVGLLFDPAERAVEERIRRTRQAVLALGVESPWRFAAHND
jgi:uncharacterized protein involved in propanediol utilization